MQPDKVSPTVTLPPKPSFTEVPRSAAPATPHSSRVGGMLDDMSWYGLELMLAVFGLLVSWIAVAYGSFALLNYLRGIDSQAALQYIGEFSLWVGAAMIVWLPLTLFFYIRSRRELVRSPRHASRLLHKLIVGYLLVNIVLGVAGLAFTVVVALLRMVIGIDDDALDTFMRLVLPSLLTAAVGIVLISAYSIRRISTKLFTIVFAGISVAIVGTLLGLSISSVSDNDYDMKAASDLDSLHSQIATVYDEKHVLPQDLSSLNGLDVKIKNRLYRYTYTKESGGKYQLCVALKTDTTEGGNMDYAAIYDDANGYSGYPSFSIHVKGEKCFKIIAVQSLYNLNSSAKDLNVPAN